MLRSSMSMQQTHTSMQSLERQSSLLPMQSGPSPHAGMGMGNDTFFARETNSGSQGPMGMSGMLVKASSLPMSQAISGAYPGQRWQQQQMMFANQQQQARLQRTLPQAQGSADMYGGQMGMQPARQSVNRGPCMGQSDGRMAREEEDVTGPMQGLHGRNASTLCPSHATMQAQQQRAAMGGVAGNGGGDWVACVADGSPMHGDNRARPGAPHTQAGAVTCATRQGAGAGPCATLQLCTSAPVGWAPATSLTRQLSGSLSTRQGDAPGMPVGSFPPGQAMGAPPHDVGAPPWAGPMPPYGPASYYGMPQPSGFMPQGMPRYMRGRAGVPVPACYMQPGGMGWVGGIADEPYGVCMAGQGMEPTSAAGETVRASTSWVNVRCKQ